MSGETAEPAPHQNVAVGRNDRIRSSPKAELTTDVAAAANRLRRGELVAFATETVYGLGGNALDPVAVARIFQAKNRPFFDPLIVHLPDADELDRVVTNVPPLAQRLIARFWPGALTLVLPKQPTVPDLVTAGLSHVAVRVPAHAQAREFLRQCGMPVAAPSANPFGRISPTTARHVLDFLGEEIDCVLDGGPCTIGVESTVLQLRDEGPPVLLRAGGVTLEELQSEIGLVQLPEPSTSTAGLPQAGPGMLSRHYAPRIPLRIVESLQQAAGGPRVGVLAFQSDPPAGKFGQVEQLSASGSLVEAAAGLFAALRRLETAPVDLLLVERFPQSGLGRALNDRLFRAARGSASDDSGS